MTTEAVKKRSPSDYIFGKVIGDGSFSTVYLAMDIHKNEEFAIKVLEKHHIRREKKMEYVTREKDVLVKLNGSNNLFVKLYCTFQDSDRLYFVLTYAKNGDILPYIHGIHFTLDNARFYAAELLLALEILNTKGIIHRDLKPENILLDANWHILLTDFGSAKIVSSNHNNIDESKEKRRNSFVGTAQYVTPEVLQGGNICFATDLWAYGCVIYKMLSKEAPFIAGSEYLIFKKILALDYVFPENFDEIAKDLVAKLLILLPESRLGASDQIPYSSIRQHKFFANINFDNLGPPPKMHSSENLTNKSDMKISTELEPGFDREKAGKLELELFQPASIISIQSIVPQRKKSQTNRNIADLDDIEINRRLEKQKNDKWHQLVEENLILKQGLIEKRKGLFPRRRMLLLTRGPHLYYVDPATMVLKGEIPWSVDIKAEPKNFKTFFVHTPNRVYYLEDPEGNALHWCKAIDDVRSYYYPDSNIATERDS